MFAPVILSEFLNQRCTCFSLWAGRAASLHLPLTPVKLRDDTHTDVSVGASARAFRLLCADLENSSMRVAVGATRTLHAGDTSDNGSELFQHGGELMGFWRKKETDFDEAYTIVEEEDGMSARELARRIDVSPSTVTRLLPSMEEAGYLLTEDDEGRLWPFKRKK